MYIAIHDIVVCEQVSKIPYVIWQIVYEDGEQDWTKDQSLLLDSTGTGFKAWSSKQLVECAQRAMS